MRSLSSQGLAALDSGRLRVRCLLKITLPSVDPFCIWDDIGTISAGGDSYIGKAGRFKIEAATSSYDAGARAARLVLSGLDPQAFALIEAAAWHQAPVLAQRAIIAVDAPAVLHLMPEFSGYLDQMIPVEASGTISSIECLLETASREASRSGARTRSDADQRERDPDDGFFSFAVSSISTTINVGRSPTQTQKKPGGFAGLLDKFS